MTDSPFNDFVRTLEFGEISGPTPVEEAHDSLEQRDLTIRLTSLLNAGVLRGLDGSSNAERSAWRSGADFAIDSLERHDGDCYEMTRLELYAVIVKAVCRIYSQVDVSVVNAAAGTVLSLFSHDLDSAIAGAWRSNMQPAALSGEMLMRLIMQAAYVYSDLNPAAVLH